MGLKRLQRRKGQSTHRRVGRSKLGVADSELTKHSFALRRAVQVATVMVPVPLIITPLQVHVKGHNRCEPFTAKRCRDLLKLQPAMAVGMVAQRISQRCSVFRSAAPHVCTHVPVDVRIGISTKPKHTTHGREGCEARGGHRCILHKYCNSRRRKRRWIILPYIGTKPLVRLDDLASVVVGLLCVWDGVDDCGIDCHRLCHACVGMFSKSRSETLHVWAKALARLDDRATCDVSILLTGALLSAAGAGAGGSA